MASKTDIATRALSKVGETRVSNIDTDNSTKAAALRDMWDTVRDKILAGYPWNFAIKRTQLAKDAAAPAWGYNNRYTLPSDFLALLEIKGNPDYRIEGGYILTDEGSPLYIKYIKRVEDTGDFDPMFVEAFASLLAYEVCEQLTQSNTKKDILYREYMENISKAYANDAIQDPPTSLQTDTWLISREDSYYDDIDYSTTVTS